MGDKFAAFLYDAVMLYAVAVNETLAMGWDPRSGQNVALKMRGKTFQGKAIIGIQSRVKLATYFTDVSWKFSCMINRFHPGFYQLFTSQFLIYLLTQIQEEIF